MKVLEQSEIDQVAGGIVDDVPGGDPTTNVSNQNGWDNLNQTCCTANMDL
ncbi:hypothetical protein [Burkholderia alba]|nr:hypothetical protein [Burkholderia alba]